MSLFSTVGKAITSATSSIGKAINPISPLISAATSYFGQESANEANSALAQNQMDFQERMSNTSYQRSMADMREAGLNPIFAYKSGGASTPSGQSATMQNSAAAGADAYNKTTNSAIANKKVSEELRVLENNAELLYQNKLKSMADKTNTNANEALTRQLLKKAEHDTSSAKSIAEANELTKQLSRRDTKFKLDNPTMMKIEQWRRAIGLGNVPNPMKLLKLPK